MTSAAAPETAPPTLATWLRDARYALEGAGFSPRDADHLAAFGFGARWGDLWARLDEPVPGSVDALLERRLAGEPLAYVLGTQPFRSLELACGPGVLVPRPETETVVDVALELCGPEALVVDVGTGTGAIALAIACERLGAEVWATEVSPEASTYAGENVRRTGLDVRVVEGDLFAGLPPGLRGRVDLVVSNPPYVDPDRPDLLGPDVGAEPPEALFAPEGGDAVLRRLVDEAPVWLRPGGALVCEIGTGAQAERVLTRLAGWADQDVREDCTGRPRVVWGVRHTD